MGYSKRNRKGKCYIRVRDYDSNILQVIKETREVNQMAKCMEKVVIDKFFQSSVAFGRLPKQR